MCLGPVLAVVLFAPTAAGFRAAIVNGVPVVCFSESPNTVVQAESGAKDVRSEQRKISVGHQVPFAAPIAFSESSNHSAPSPICSPASPRAP
jgi:hypothetical protein